MGTPARDGRDLACKGYLAAYLSTDAHCFDAPAMLRDDATDAALAFVADLVTVYPDLGARMTRRVA